MGQQYRAKRTPDQIIRSVVAYLQWRAGESWIRVSDREQRFSQDRLDYIEAIRVVTDARYSEPKGPALALPPLNATSPISPVERDLAARSRASLVDELLQVNPALTDRKLLLHLGRPKLAHMLAVARARGKARRTA